MRNKAKVFIMRNSGTPTFMEIKPDYDTITGILELRDDDYFHIGTIGIAKSTFDVYAMDEVCFRTPPKITGYDSDKDKFMLGTVIISKRNPKGDIISLSREDISLIRERICITKERKIKVGFTYYQTSRIILRFDR